jgi:hypothetical protein
MKLSCRLTKCLYAGQTVLSPAFCGASQLTRPTFGLIRFGEGEFWMRKSGVLVHSFSRFVVQTSACERVRSQHSADAKRPRGP